MANDAAFIVLQRYQATTHKRDAAFGCDSNIGRLFPVERHAEGPGNPGNRTIPQ